MQFAREMLLESEDEIKMQKSYDIWRLGILVYEVMTGESYWHDSLTDLDVLQVLANPTALLPHEERPVGREVMQKVLVHMLERNPDTRINATDLYTMMEEEVVTASMVKTLNSNAPIHQQQPVELNTT